MCSRTVKKRKIFEPESQQDKEKKKKKRGRPKGSGKVGRPKKGARPALHHLLEDEENGSGSGNEDRGGDGGEGASADGHRCALFEAVVVACLAGCGDTGMDRLARMGRLFPRVVIR